MSWTAPLLQPLLMGDWVYLVEPFVFHDLEFGVSLVKLQVLEEF